MTQIIVITGASSGFGALAAHALAKSGHTVYAGMRDTRRRNAPQVEALKAHAAQTRVDLRAVELDVQSEPSVEAAITTILRESGRLDTVVHNAGHMVFGPAEAFTPEQYAALYDVNVLGTQRVNRVALPILRRQGRGLLVWVSSTSTRGGTPPWLAPYFAAKAGMDSLAVSYAGELMRWGSKPRSSCPAPTQRAPTISPMPGHQQIQHGRRSMPTGRRVTSLISS
jgi:NAD(P)-dependent dehydrogenase (short-subunit alcohol dehydrogenase family)